MIHTVFPAWSEVTRFAYLARLQVTVALSQNKSYEVPKDAHQKVGHRGTHMQLQIF